MNQGSLLKHEAVLPLFSEGDQNVIYRFEDAPDGTVVRLSRVEFVEMGSPTAITVTIVPGDELGQ